MKTVIVREGFLTYEQSDKVHQYHCVQIRLGMRGNSLCNNASLGHPFNRENLMQSLQDSKLPQ